uniref:Uncharacterized protein n=1 Tax=Physcomitrium patens TaxID=3218 RepID=A0A2K1JW27_PHYPA|nr:hypothetical protein PHYPA_015501 [Physcomitrium patens]
MTCTHHRLCTTKGSSSYGPHLFRSLFTSFPVAFSDLNSTTHMVVFPNMATSGRFYTFHLCICKISFTRME